MKTTNSNILDFTTSNISDLIVEFETDSLSGLSNQSVEERTHTFGPNRLETQQVNGWQIFLRQFKSAFIFLLLGALGITLLLVNTWMR